MIRLGLSERTVIEAGIYRRDSFQEIAKQIGVKPRAVSEEIRRNRILSLALRIIGKDCRFASECTKRHICGNVFCNRECVRCRKVDCRSICLTYLTPTCKID